MSQDQAARGFEDESRSTGWLLIIGIAIVAALFSLATRHTSTGAAPQPPAPSAFALPTPSASASASAGPSSGPSAAPSGSPSPANPTDAILAQISGYVSVDQVCSPVTDGRRSLTVRFLLRNATQLDERLLWVSPELPMGGLRFVKSDEQRGTCAHPIGKPVPFTHQPLPVGGSIIVGLHFALPDSCPAPYPVQAVVTVGIGGAERLDSVTLYSDLGAVKFKLCKGQTP